MKIVALSRLTEGYKNFELLIRLAAVLHPLGAVESVTIVGGGPRLDALRAKAQALGVGDVVSLTGYLPDSEVFAMLAASHLGVFPSRDSAAEGGFEGFGLVVHEMAFAGLPVLVGNAGGAADIVAEEWAVPLDPDDLYAWVDAVAGLHGDEERRCALAKVALHWASKIDTTAGARRYRNAVFGEDGAVGTSR